jgi:hypothetical protein
MRCEEKVVELNRHRSKEMNRLGLSDYRLRKIARLDAPSVHCLRMLKAEKEIRGAFEVKGRQGRSRTGQEGRKESQHVIPKTRASHLGTTSGLHLHLINLIPDP